MCVFVNVILFFVYVCVFNVCLFMCTFYECFHLFMFFFFYVFCRYVFVYVYLSFMFFSLYVIYLFISTLYIFYQYFLPLIGIYHTLPIRPWMYITAINNGMWLKVQKKKICPCVKTCSFCTEIHSTTEIFIIFPKEKMKFYELLENESPL